MSAQFKVNDFVFVKGLGPCKFRIKAVKAGAPEPYHLVYAEANGDKESEYGKCSEEELLPIV